MSPEWVDFSPFRQSFASDLDDSVVSLLVSAGNGISAFIEEALEDAVRSPQSATQESAFTRTL